MQPYIDNSDEGITIFDDRDIPIIKWPAAEIAAKPLASARDIQAFTEVFCTQGIEGVKQLVEAIRPKSQYYIPFDFQAACPDGFDVLHHTLQDQFLYVVVGSDNNTKMSGVRLNIIVGTFATGEDYEADVEWLVGRLESGYFEMQVGHIYTHLKFSQGVYDTMSAAIKVAADYLTNYWNTQNQTITKQEQVR